MPPGQARAGKPRAISAGTEEGRAEGREARQKADTPRAQRKLKRPWEPETGAMPHSSDSSDSSSFSQSPPPSKQVKRGPFPSPPRMESPSGWAMGGQEEGWHPPLVFSQCRMVGLSRNSWGERDAGLSREPQQEPRPPSWVQAERGGPVTWGYAGATGGMGPPGTVGPVIHTRDTRAGSRQEASA